MNVHVPVLYLIMYKSGGLTSSSCVILQYPVVCVYLIFN